VRRQENPGADPVVGGSSAGVPAGQARRPAQLRGAALRSARHPRARSTGAKRGRLTVEFANLEDLERIYRVILDGREDIDWRSLRPLAFARFNLSHSLCTNL